MFLIKLLAFGLITTVGRPRNSSLVWLSTSVCEYFEDEIHVLAVLDVEILILAEVQGSAHVAKLLEVFLLTCGKFGVLVHGQDVVFEEPLVWSRELVHLWRIRYRLSGLL